MKKIFNQKNFNNFVGTPLCSRVNIYIHFCLQVYFKVSVALLLTNCLPPVANLPPVSLIPVAICPRCRWHRSKFAAGIVDTGGKFATGINNTSETGGKICRRCRWYRWQICHRCRWYRQAAGVVDIGGKFATGVNLELRISPRIFEKIRNGPNGILRGLGETDSWKKPVAKNLVTLSL